MNNKPIGILPVEHSFKVAYEKGGYDTATKGFSPIDRTNSLRRDFLKGEFRINSERAVLVTEAHKAYEAEPVIIKKAKVLKYVLERITLYTYKDELIVGTPGAPNKHAPIYPEFSYNWIMDELENFPFEDREHDNYEIDDETKDQLRSIADYWKGRTVEERISSQLTFDEQKASNMGVGMYLLNLYHYGGIGHLAINYEKVLQLGYVGYKKLIEDRIAKVDPTTPFGTEERNTLNAMLITMDAAIIYVSRYAEEYEAKAKAETDPRLKKEYETIAKNCRNLAAGAPTNTWEAVQLAYFCNVIMLIESNGHSLSYGRMDQYLYPFYKKDIENNVFDKMFIQEILEAVFIKMGTAGKLRDRMTSIANNGRSFGGESITLGGVDRDGNDVTNDLTFMLLEASAHTRMMVPWTCLRIHENTPRDLKVKAVEVIRAGSIHPKLYNDVAAIESQLRMGKTIEDAREYAVIGCVEISVPAREFGWHDASYYNMAKTFELAMNDGRCFHCGPNCPRYSICGGVGKKLGLSTGSLATFKNIDEAIESFDKQMKYFISQMAAGINVMEFAHKELAPTPFSSVFYENCIENAKDLSAGGAEFNHVGPQGTGIGTVADSFCAIEQLVFDENYCTGKELLDAVKANWEGNEKLYALVNSSKVKHYGNDDDSADRFAQLAFDTYCKYVEKYETPRGGKYKPGVYGVSSNIAFGLLTGASIDGRKIGEPVSDNMGPVHTQAGSHDISGPTAVANSVSKIDHPRAGNGTLLNWKFNPSSVAGDTGRDNLIELIDTYFERKGMHSQLNIVSTEAMKDAMKNPENYKSMLIRVAGYCAYFVELNELLQLDLIGRTELSFE